ncbi:MAG: hypothetical protein IANPNBLG_02651 [Bryobacteraceae bacterium]|nr:hypothetical protein [Bryobacteraceae bacterium]
MNKRIFGWRPLEAGRRLLALAGAAFVLLAATQTLLGGVAGKVVAIGGNASDLALDEARGVLYVANFTANRVEVVSLGDGSVQSSINVAAQPSSLALSPDGRYLVIAHFGSFTAGSSNNGLTVIDLATNGRQTFVLGSAPLGVAFGIDNQALVATASEFILFDPITGNTRALGSFSTLTTKSLPQPVANFPSNIVGASMAVSGDGLWIFGSAAVGSGSSGGSGSQSLEFTYNVTTRSINSVLWTWSPPPGPRAVSSNYDGSVHMSGWAMFDRQLLNGLSQFPGASGVFNIGTHVFDTARGRLYAQFSTATPNSSSQQAAAPPVLQVLDADNLAVLDQFNLPENFAGKSIINSDSSMLFGISDSGILMIPIGNLDNMPRVAATREDVVFRGNFCDRRVTSQEVTILDPGGGNTDFTLSVSTPGVSVSPSSGVTPATVRINVDPNAFQNSKGTVTALINIATARGVNIPKPVRVLINNREPDQRGTAVNVPGKLVDLLADPVRDRFYVLRQDTNQVYVYDGGTQTRIAVLKTANTPTQLAITFDRRYLMVGHDNAQLIKVFDLDTLEESLPIYMPGGHYPRSIAASAKAILVASRVAGPENKISRVDFASRTATPLPSLGIFENKIDASTILVASPNGSTILGAQSDGTVYLYDANVDTFTISRKDFPSLSGAYAASNFNQFVVGNSLLNASLVQTAQFETGTGKSSGFAFLDQGGFRTTAPDSSSPGVIARVTNQSGQLSRATRLVEAPILPQAAQSGQAQSGASQSWVQVFTRSIQPLYSRNALIALTTSGFTALPWSFDASVAAPRIERVVNAADNTAAVAPGSLVSIFGANLSPINQATQLTPLPTALGESCLTVNGLPLPVVFVSPGQINGQIPFQVDGNVSLILRTPGGVSDTFNLTILPTAPGVFRNGVAGTRNDLPAVFRAANGLLVTDTNPIHRGDTITIYLTGLGRTSPAVDAGVPAPGDPLASVIVPPAVTLGGVALPVEFAGLTPGSIGVYQINARVPSDVPPGLDQPLTISQGSGASAIGVRVVD